MSSSEAATRITAGSPARSVTTTETKVVIFDLWQTLVDIQHRVVSQLIETLGTDLSPSQFADRLAASEVYLSPKPIEETLDGFLSQYSHDPAIRKKCLLKWMQCAGEAALVPGSEKLIEELKQQGLRTCLLTNVDSYGLEHFKFPRLIDKFDFVFASCEQGVSKPSLVCWEIIRDYFRVDYSEMVMVGDSLEQDIIPAQKLGLKTVLVGSSGVAGLNCGIILKS